MHGLEMGAQHGLEAFAIDTAGEHFQAFLQLADLESLKYQHDYQANAREHQHYRGEITRDRIHNYLRSIVRSLPAGTAEPLTLAERRRDGPPRSPRGQGGMLSSTRAKASMPT